MITWKNLDRDQQSWVTLVCLLALMGLLLNLIGRELISVIISIVFAYLIQKPLLKLKKIGLSHNIASYICVIIFIYLVILVLLGIIPPIVNQANTFLNDLPKIISVFQKLLNHLAEYLPNYLSREDIVRFTQQAQSYMTVKSTSGVVYLINMIPVTFEVLIYFVLVPMMLFFFVKDDRKILKYCRDFMPEQASLLKKFWHQLDIQLGNYLQGKIIEVFLVGILSAIVYGFLGLKFALLMGCFMGISVLIPIVGATLVTIPVILIGFWQFGTDEMNFMYLMVAHLTLLLVDGNVLVPLLFSEKLNLHPLAILIAILFFGSFLGFWGLFFAIPLLTGLNILLNLYKDAFVKQIG